jgi:hypothetical protein
MPFYSLLMQDILIKRELSYFTRENYKKYIYGIDNAKVK